MSDFEADEVTRLLEEQGIWLRPPTAGIGGSSLVETYRVPSEPFVDNDLLDESEPWNDCYA